MIGSLLTVVEAVAVAELGDCGSEYLSYLFAKPAETCDEYQLLDHKHDHATNLQILAVLFRRNVCYIVILYRQRHANFSRAVMDTESYITTGMHEALPNKLAFIPVKNGGSHAESARTFLATLAKHGAIPAFHPSACANRKNSHTGAKSILSDVLLV
jgi:hypothetical protein